MKYIFTAMRLILLLVILMDYQIVKAQNATLDYPKNIVATLCADSLHGRGYVNKGATKAALFIQKEYIKNGVEPIKNKHLQAFEFPVNTFPDQMKIAIDGKPLRAGIDYLLHAYSPQLKESFKIWSPSVEDLLTLKNLEAMKGKFVLLPIVGSDRNEKDKKKLEEFYSFIKYHKDCPAAGVIEVTDQKLTWSAATFVTSRPIISIKNDVIHDDVKKIKVNIDQKFYNNYEGYNVIGRIRGKSSDSLLVFTAHYDHLGRMGSGSIFPGANDNASGVAMLLSLSKHFTQNTPKYDVIFIAFGAEELGLLGSKFFVENPWFNLKKIKFLVNMDISGTGDEGIKVVNGSKFRHQFDLLKQLNRTHQLLPDVKIRGESCNSDHCPFYSQGVPSFFIYTLGGIQAYHDINDRAETLPLTQFDNYRELLIHFASEL